VLHNYQIHAALTINGRQTTLFLLVVQFLGKPSATKRKKKSELEVHIISLFDLII
jgi:hypothetical protein